VVRIVETVHKGPSSVAVGIYEPQIINSCHPVFPCWCHLNELYVCTLLNQTIIIAVVVYKSEVLKAELLLSFGIALFDQKQTCLMLVKLE